MQKAAVILAACLVCFFAIPIASAKVSEEKLRAHIKTLASDEFEGREPGTDGEKKTIEYIASAWKSAGLSASGKDGSWFQPVPLVQYGQSAANVVFSSAGRTLKFNADEIILIGKDASYQKKSVPLVFGGYGFKDDGSVISDVNGKIVLLLTDRTAAGNNPGRSANAAREALISAGAEGVLLVADGEPGNWSAMRRRFVAGPVVLEGLQARAAIDGAISSEFAVGMVTAAAQDWDKLRIRAKDRAFDTVSLGIDAALDITTNIKRFESQNVVAKIPAKKSSDRKKAVSGSVLFMAHWDHLGICRPEGEADRICNGAIDNASGIAVITEVASALAKARYDRDIYFLATTAEEKGLLGARFFADNSPIPLNQIVVSFNLDTVAIVPAGAKVAVIGRGQTNLDGDIDAVARKINRKVETSTDANSYIRRQDGWALAEKGVPSLMLSGSFADLSLLEKFLASEYHGPNDELSASTDLSGAAEDADLHIALGKYFASTRTFKGIKADKGNKTGS